MKVLWVWNFLKVEKSFMRRPCRVCTPNEGMLLGYAPIPCGVGYSQVANLAWNAPRIPCMGPHETWKLLVLQKSFGILKEHSLRNHPQGNYPQREVWYGGFTKLETILEIQISNFQMCFLFLFQFSKNIPSHGRRMEERCIPREKGAYPAWSAEKGGSLHSGLHVSFRV